jgi:hypothetical protein
MPAAGFGQSGAVRLLAGDSGGAAGAVIGDAGVDSGLDHNRYPNVATVEVWGPPRSANCYPADMVRWLLGIVVFFVLMGSLVIGARAMRPPHYPQAPPASPVTLAP